VIAGINGRGKTTLLKEVIYQIENKLIQLREWITLNVYSRLLKKKQTL
jgi:ABC-type cobalamin/Fe3+-siderophores transport system ATPase subunit